jgi:hypothetical protein
VSKATTGLGAACRRGAGAQSLASLDDDNGVAADPALARPGSSSSYEYVKLILSSSPAELRGTAAGRLLTPANVGGSWGTNGENGVIPGSVEAALGVAVRVAACSPPITGPAVGAVSGTGSSLSSSGGREARLRKEPIVATPSLGIAPSPDSPAEVSWSAASLRRASRRSLAEMTERCPPALGSSLSKASRCEMAWLMRSTSAWLCWASASNVTPEDTPSDSAASGPSGPFERILLGASHGGVTLVVTFRMGTQSAPPGFLKPSLICPQSLSAPRVSLTSSELLSIGSGTMNSAPEMTGSVCAANAPALEQTSR